MGVGTFLVGKILSPFFSMFTNASHQSFGTHTTTTTSAFKIVEHEKILSIYDSIGEEVFQIDKST